MQVTTNAYETLAAVNVNEHVEKKGNLSYLSWAWAVDQLLRRDPTANWSYNDPVMYGDTMMVSCCVAAFGVARTMQLPVMDHRNKAIANPDAFQVNTAMQRCLVKAIALHGLGLYIYAGEDLPVGETAEEDAAERIRAAHISPTEVNREEFDKLDADTKDMIRTHASEIARMYEGKGDVFGYVEALGFDQETRMALWSQLPAPIRAALKKARKEMQPPHLKDAA